MPIATTGPEAVNLKTGTSPNLLPRTSAQILGPFYPLGEPSKGGDLTRVTGRNGVAQGQVLHIGGRVLARDGTPTRNCKIEIWQANAFGKYTHGNDSNPAPLDPNFEGFAVVHTDDEGRYSLKTIKPAAYPAGTGMRPSHIHFYVYGRHERLVTQMYFAGDLYHDTDPVLLSAARPQTLVMPLHEPVIGMAPDAKCANFDIVLIRG